MCICVFFFFQAEDGIRDDLVTGVQTCALPISESVRAALHDEPVPDWRAPTLATLTDRRFSDRHWVFERKFDGMRCLGFRSEERRVGKECRSRGSAYH